MAKSRYHSQHTDDHDYTSIFPEKRQERQKRIIQEQHPNASVIINQIRVKEKRVTLFSGHDIPLFARIVIYFNLALLSIVFSLILSSLSYPVLFPIFLILCGLISAITFILYIVGYRIYWYLIAIYLTFSSLLLLWGLATGVRIGNYFLMAI